MRAEVGLDNQGFPLVQWDMASAFLHVVSLVAGTLALIGCHALYLDAQTSQVHGGWIPAALLGLPLYVVGWLALQAAVRTLPTVRNWSGRAPGLRVLVGVMLALLYIAFTALLQWSLGLPLLPQ
jgi:hypothetical protein